MPTDELTVLAEEHNAMVMVDDCHGEGVLGDGGRGIVDHFKLQGRVDFEGGSFSKALGVWAWNSCRQGNHRTVTTHLITLDLGCFQARSHPGLQLRKKLRLRCQWMSLTASRETLGKQGEYFRSEMQSLGFDTGVSTTPIIPVMCGESSVAKGFQTRC